MKIVILRIAADDGVPVIMVAVGAAVADPDGRVQQVPAHPAVPQAAPGVAAQVRAAHPIA